MENGSQMLNLTFFLKNFFAKISFGVERWFSAKKKLKLSKIWKFDITLWWHRGFNSRCMQGWKWKTDHRCWISQFFSKIFKQKFKLGYKDGFPKKKFQMVINMQIGFLVVQNEWKWKTDHRCWISQFFLKFFSQKFKLGSKDGFPKKKISNGHQDANWIFGGSKWMKMENGSQMLNFTIFFKYFFAKV